MLVAIALATGVAVASAWHWWPHGPSPSTIAEIKAQLPALISADGNLLDLPANPAEQQRALAADRAGRLRAAVLVAWDASAADQRLQDVAENRLLMVRETTDVYDQVRVIVVSWDRITSSHDDAKVRITLRTPVHRTATGVWDGDGRAQWEFGLRRQTDGTWKLTSERITAYLDGQG